MKGLGMAGTGLGSAAFITPVFHDLDELISSEDAEWNRPWWVKQREIDNPTLEFDWSQIERGDMRSTCFQPYVLAYYWGGVNEYKRVAAIAATKAAQALGTQPGFYLKDSALGSGNWNIMNPAYFPSHVTNYYFTGPKTAPTPEQMGLPKWQGTPEEAARMLRRAAIFYGAQQVGFTELGAGGSNARKLIWTYLMGTNYFSTKYIDSGVWPPPPEEAKKVNMEDVDPGYEDEKVVHLPNKSLWDISFMIGMSREMWRAGQGTKIQNAAAGARYRQMQVIQGCMQEFLRGLGYNGYGYARDLGGLMPAGASAILSGLTEQARHSDSTISPEMGSIAGYFSLLTDLPLAPNHPIDAGIFRFCHTCYKCADECPTQAISHDTQPTWDLPTPYGKPNINNTPGKKMFYTDLAKCRTFMEVTPYGSCMNCRPSCTFNVNTASSIHKVVKMTTSTTPLFNSFFYKMGKTFGYGIKEPEEWWDMSLPSYGFDTTVFASSGGYNK